MSMLNEVKYLINQVIARVEALEAKVGIASPAAPADPAQVDSEQQQESND